MWIRHELKLNYTTPFQVLIEGVVGASFLSDIGLDDTVFTPECESYALLELPMTTIDSSTTAKPCPVANQIHCTGTDICIDKELVNFLVVFYLIYDNIAFIRSVILLLIVRMRLMKYEKNIKFFFFVRLYTFY